MKTRFLLINLHSFALRFPINVAWPLLKSTLLLFFSFLFCCCLGLGRGGGCCLIFDNRVRRGMGLFPT